MFGLVAQLGERSVRIREVEGSNPFESIKSLKSDCFGNFWVIFFVEVNRLR